VCENVGCDLFAEVEDPFLLESLFSFTAVGLLVILVS
jgi:hypothetical protein